LWFLIACSAVAAFVASQNLAEITVNLRPFIKYPVVLPLYQALTITFVFGAATSAIFLGSSHYRKSFTIRRLKKKLQNIESSEQKTEWGDPDFSSELSAKAPNDKSKLGRNFLSVRD
jgi:hypothetical protein